MSVATALMPVAAARAAPVTSSTRLHVTVTLNPRRPAALAAYARAVSAPGSSLYHRYLTPAQFATRFGATRAQVNAVRSSLAAHGLRPGRASAGSLSIPVTATAAQLQRAFDISPADLSLPGRHAADAIAAAAAIAAPAFDARAAGVVQSVVGLGTTAVRPLLVRRSPPAGPRALARPHAVTGGPQPCPDANAAAPGQSAYTADEIASAYGFSGLYGAGDEGAGVNVAVYELESDDPGDIAAYQSCYGTHANISYVPVDGGPGAGPAAGTGEAALDIENVIGLAPDVNVIVYRGPNSGSGSPGSGPYDTFSAIINQDRASVISVSWGECEAQLGQASAIAENTLFQQAAVQGESIVAASGDSGSEDCDAGGALPQTQLAVDDPASQPYVTGVGGTSLQALGPRPTESAWNNGGSLVGALLNPGAGGGGISSFWPMPPSQLDSGAGLGVRSGDAGGSACSNPGGYCRVVPDVSADADPTTGYLIYWNGSGQAGQTAGWQGIGGTSGAAPVWAALLALADASRACARSSVGYAGPALYRAAGSHYATDFNDVTAGNNDYTATNGGKFTAAPGYDPATGLGTPNAAALAGDLCADTVRLTNPGPQRSTARASVSLRLRGSGAPGTPISYHASGLPPGLSLGSSSGRISGRPLRAGSFAVRVSVRDSGGSIASQAFTWTVGAAPRISQVSLTATADGRPELAFTLATGRNAPPISKLELRLPRGLRLVSRDGVSLAAADATARPLRFRDHAAHSTLTITLRSPAGRLRVTLAPPSLAAAAGRTPDATRPGARKLVLSLDVIDATAGRSHLQAKVAASS